MRESSSSAGRLSCAATLLVGRRFPADVLAVGRDVDLAVLRLKPGVEHEDKPGAGDTFASRLFGEKVATGVPLQVPARWGRDRALASD